MQLMDPLDVKDFEINGFAASGIKVYGLSNAKRSGFATIVAQGDEMMLDANFTFKDLRSNGSFIFYAAIVVPLRGGFEMRFGKIDVSTRINVTGKSIRLVHVKVVDTQNIRFTELTGLPTPLNIFALRVSNKKIRDSVAEYRAAMEDSISTAINDEIRRLTDPDYLPAVKTDKFHSVSSSPTPSRRPRHIPRLL